MNKAFVRESEEPEHQKCPACKTIGQSVSTATLTAHLPPADAGRLAGEVSYCPNASCDIGYFDSVGQTIPSTKILQPSWPKAPLSPVCACFGITVDQVIDAASAADPLPIRQLIVRSKTPEAQCILKAASGRCCIPEVQQLYLKHAKRKT